MTAKLTANGSNGPKLVPRPNGRGALLTGGVPGNKGGMGAVPSVVRQVLTEKFHERAGLIDEIVAGEPVQRIRMEVASIAGLLACSDCGKPMSPATSKDGEIEVSVVVSATPRERIEGWKAMGQYGIGTKNEIDIVSPDVKARLVRQVAVLEDELDPETAQRVLDRLESEVWV